MSDKFAGGDSEYLRTEQYVNADKLLARANLHVRYSTSPTSWFDWMVAQIPWRSGFVVEAGCGTGSLWAEGLPPVEGPIILTDQSVGMVERAAAAARGRGYAVEGRVAAAQDLPVVDRSCAHVIANHMLYHVPAPATAVVELARVVADDGLVSVSTNGSRHMRALKEIEHAVFNTRVIDRTVSAFGIETGQAMLDTTFEEVELHRFPDELAVTSRDDALAYMTSFPPGEDATPTQLADLVEHLEAAFAQGGGTLVVEKECGLFLCRGPRR